MVVLYSSVISMTTQQETSLLDANNVDALRTLSEMTIAQSKNLDAFGEDQKK